MTNRIATVRKHKRRDRLEDNRFLMDFAEKAGRLALKRHQERGETAWPPILSATPDQTGKVLTPCHILNSAPKNVPRSRSASRRA